MNALAPVRNEGALDLVEVSDVEPGSAAGGSDKRGLAARSHAADGKHIVFALRKDGHFRSLAQIIILKLKPGFPCFPFYHLHYVGAEPVPARHRVALFRKK